MSKVLPEICECESHYFIRLKVWEGMLQWYKVLNKEPPPKPILVLSAKAKEDQKWELE